MRAGELPQAERVRHLTWTTSSVSHVRSLDDLRAAACSQLGLTVKRSLKSGGQKTVALVDQAGVDRVLKLVQVGASDPTVLERSRREFALLANTKHPNVVEVRSDLVMLEDSSSTVDGAVWLEEFLDGDDLGDLVAAPWPIDDVRAMGLGVAAGVGALHNQRVIHRDLSANNIRRLGDGSYKVMDPGFAKHTLRSGITVGGQPGTPGFMTPEHLQPYSGPTPASDVFAIGALMYLAATSELPIPYRGDESDYVNRLARAAYAPIRVLRADFPSPLADIVERCLHRHPVRRYRDAGRLQDALETAT